MRGATRVTLGGSVARKSASASSPLSSAPSSPSSKGSSSGARAATAAASPHPAAAGSGPRTRLPFLQNTVRKALQVEGPVAPRPYPIAVGGGGGGSAAAAQTAAAGAKAKGKAPRASPGSELLYKDDRCIIVNDAYPKSRVHCLVMPLDLALTSLNALTAEHVPLLEHMDAAAQRYIAFLQSSPAGRVPADAGATSRYRRRRFICGFHALPSLPMLHMHLLSLDLDSAALKTRKHYNSFATFFFLTADRVLEDLRRHGRVTLNQDVTRLHQMESQPMRCLWCGAPLASVPAAKQHLAACPDNQSLIVADP